MKSINPYTGPLPPTLQHTYTGSPGNAGYDHQRHSTNLARWGYREVSVRQFDTSEGGGCAFWGLLIGGLLLAPALIGIPMLLLAVVARPRKRSAIVVDYVR